MINNQTQLSFLLVKELQKRKVLEDVICQYEIETVRVCGCCGRLMNEGWMFQGFETFCSDRCLMRVHPEVDLTWLREQACEEDSDSYWTSWEG